MEEIWKGIEGYEELYQISNLGRVRSLDRNVGNRRSPQFLFKGKVIKTFISKYGYLVVSISKKSKHKSFNIHRLVAEAFIPNPENKRTVNHKNGIKSDCSIDNLEWCTHSENSLHAYKTELRMSAQLGKIGIECKKSKQIVQLTIDGIFINTFWGRLEAERETGVTSGNIKSVLLKKSHTAGGFRWMFKKDYEDLQSVQKL